MSASTRSGFFLAIFRATLVRQSFEGQHAYNEEAVQHQEQTISWARYVASSVFGAAVVENWQSEWLQFLVFVAVTVWLVPRGSPESKPPEDAGLETDKEQKVERGAARGSPGWAKAGGWRTHVFANCSSR